MQAEIKQRSPEWFEQRKNRMTGSRIGAILGVSPWQSPDDIIRAMVREHHGAPSEWVENPATTHGTNNEQRAILCFMKRTGLNVEQCGFFPYGDRLGASPDGLVGSSAIIEVKVPFGLRNEKEAQFKTLADQPHYWHQVQMEMLATGRDEAFFVQYIAPKGDPFAPDYVPEQINIEHVKRDENWIDKVLPGLDAFYKRLLSELDDPAHLDPLRVAIDTPQTADLLAKIDELRARQKEDAIKEKELLSELVELAGGKDADVHGRKLTLVRRQGSVSAAALIKKYSVSKEEQDELRGKPSESWRLT